MDVAYISLALIYHAKGNTKEAIAILEQGLGVLPSNYGIFIQYMELLTSAKKYDKVITSFEKMSIREAEYDPAIWNSLGIAYAKKLGFKVVAEIEYPYTATAATNECMQLRKAKAQYVVYHGYSGATAHTAIFFKTAKKILKDVQLMGTHYTTLRFTILTGQEAFDGYVGVSTRPIMDAVPRIRTPLNNPMVKLAHDFAKKYRPEEYKKGLKAGGIKDLFLYNEGLMYAFLIQKALTDADNKYELTREGVKNALDNMVWDFNGMFGGKSFSWKSHTVPMLRLYRARVEMVKMGDKMVPTGGVFPISDWINTDEIQW